MMDPMVLVNRQFRHWCLFGLITLMVGCAGPAGNTASENKEIAGEFRSEDSAKAAEQLKAAHQLFQQNEFEQVRLLLEKADFNSMSISQQTDYALLKAKNFLRLFEPQESLHWLAGEFTYLFDGLPMENQIEIAILRAEAWEMSGQYLAAARERIYLAPVLEGLEQEENHEMIWANLQLIPQFQVDALAQTESIPDLQGWLKLASLSFEYEADLDLHLEAINQWIKDHPRHPAALKLPGGLEILNELTLDRPKHIALLLPLSGQLQSTAEAIRDGIMAAYFQAAEAGHPIPKITVADTSDTNDIVGQYNLLVTQGVELIIGPLSKKHVRELQAQPGLPVPVLALNQGDQTAEQPENLYQFGLSPEDEARQVAQRSFQEGHRTMAVLVPAGNWGQRIAEAFNDQYDLAGGDVVTFATFGGSKDGDYLNVVRGLFNLDASVNRTAEIERVIGEDVKYEPRRRQDVDAIFVAALPSQARQILPMFEFQYAGDLPVYGISTVYSGINNPSLNKDIEGIQFVDLPWQLMNPSLKQEIDQVIGTKESINFERLYALGIDAYQLHIRLKQLTRSDSSRIQGQTGVLAMDDFNRIRRELTWATIENGKVKVINLTESKQP